MRINKEHVVGVFCLAISGLVLYFAKSFPPGPMNITLTGPAFFPNVLAAALIFLGALQVAIGFRVEAKKKKSPEVKTGGEADGGKLNYFKMLEFIVLTLAYILLFQPLGFFPTTLLFLFLLMILLGVTIGKSVIYTVVYTAVIYLMFGKLFVIGLPSGVLSALGM